MGAYQHMPLFKMWRCDVFEFGHDAQGFYCWIIFLRRFNHAFNAIEDKAKFRAVLQDHESSEATQPDEFLNVQLLFHRTLTSSGA